MAKDIPLKNLAPPKIEAKAPSKVQVTESVLVIGTTKYKKIEYGTESFYLRLQSKEAADKPAEPESKDRTFRCMKNMPYQEEDALVLAEAKVTTVASVYVEGLRNKCVTFDVRKHWDSEAGIKLKTSENSDMRLGVEALPATGLTPKASLNLGF